MLRWLRMIFGRSASFPIMQKQSPFIGFAAGAGLRAPGEIFSVRRIEWRRVCARTGGNFRRFKVARASGLRVCRWQAGGMPYINRYDKNFIVCARRFDLVDVAGVSDLLAIRRNRIHVLAAEIKGWHVVIARSEISWSSGGRARRSPISRARHRHGRLYTLHKQMATLEFSERTPMPIKQA